MTPYWVDIHNELWHGSGGGYYSLGSSLSKVQWYQERLYEKVLNNVDFDTLCDLDLFKLIFKNNDYNVLIFTANHLYDVMLFRAS